MLLYCAQFFSEKTWNDREQFLRLRSIKVLILSPLLHIKGVLENFVMIIGLWKLLHTAPPQSWYKLPLNSMLWILPGSVHILSCASFGSNRYFAFPKTFFSKWFPWLPSSLWKQFWVSLSVAMGSSCSQISQTFGGLDVIGNQINNLSQARHKLDRPGFKVKIKSF